MIHRRAFSCLLALSLLAASLGSTPPAAAETIPPRYINVAHEFGIPPQILYAVAKTESGSRLTTGAVRPWPWTLNVEGRGERYRTRTDALRALKAHLAAGRRSVDIGLMQVNWRWHARRLRNPEIALDPIFNLRTGARILAERYRESRNWLVAIGRYHSPGNRVRAKAYRQRVVQRLKRLSGAPG